MDYLEVMCKICPKCPYNEKYRIGTYCNKFSKHPYPIEECPNIEKIIEAYQK